MTENPFLSPSDLPYQLPPFERIKAEHYLPAFEAGMEEQLKAVAAIVADPEEPTFANTVVALERSGLGTLKRVGLAFYNKYSSDTDDELNAIESEVSPKLAAHADKILLDAELFARIDALWRRRAELGLDEQDERLLERYHTEFVRGGAALDEAGKERLSQINTELAELSSKFNHQILTDINDAAVHVTDREELEGLSEDQISAAASAAADRGLDGWLITQSNFSLHPLLADLEHRGLRERIYRATIGRGAGNAETLLRMMRLRAEKARLLGFEHFAAYIAADQTAGDADVIAERLAGLAEASVRNARSEAAELQAIIDAEGGDFTLAAWDWSFYAKQVRQAKYGFDAEALKPYLELDRVLVDGVFYAAEKEFGLTFTPRPDLQGYHPEARVWEVFDDGAPLGLFVGDFFTRDSKKGGAWMNPLVVQSDLTGDKPVVVNNLNIVKPSEGQPALITVDNVTTLFHEFGHALHGLLSACRYPKTSMTSTPRDFVEYPSQVNEMWERWPEVVHHYARHHETGEPAPAELLAQWEASGRFGEGFASTEYLGAALLDQAWHRLTPEEVPDGGDDPYAVVEAFERKALEDAGIYMPEIAPRYRSGYFAHISIGYAAGYYSYIWSEILDADTVEWFKERGGLTRENGDHFREHLLSKGGSIDPMESYRRFRGRDAEIDPLLERRGLK
ncbi:M3 family metallopeptidase [Glycomyces sp. TRM65418]|uniref:M3 family metallopeptidase n=1 Tax=Glycomyces sp. TRM65418 TaxID=2867006 RepID=UPI001CE5DA4D|nr:M3 family metallopeptidase [Glycomyces sp. TRM65418]MCC3765446.1 M3 family metallopeptidase [Glycomyces sp. TRM65418]QZD55056.1 M3 family metallopeptidase [Glycomyces sp. TRM65418]